MRADSTRSVSPGGGVLGDREVVVELDLRLLGCARGGGLGLGHAHDALDHAVARAVGEGAQAEQELGGFGDDVRPGARVQCARGEDRRCGGGGLAGGQRLQAHHQRGRHEQRIDGGVGLGGVAALAEEGDPDRIGGGHEGARLAQDDARGQRADVLPEHDARVRESFQQTVVDHALRARAGLLGGLEQRDHGAGHRVRGQFGAGAEQRGDMDVMAARVHDAGNGGGVVETGLLLYRQRVHVGAQPHHRTGTAVQNADNTGAADVFGHLPAGHGAQFLGDQAGGGVLLARQLRMRVQVPVDLLPVLGGCGHGRTSFVGTVAPARRASRARNASAVCGTATAAARASSGPSAIVSKAVVYET